MEDDNMKAIKKTRVLDAVFYVYGYFPILREININSAS